ncbi:ABC transporter permease [Nocardioides sp. Y6]|uniref:ABC transporter permease n=1 Tax=Nocardioides malaquae TaxID=2773426 RepID=A0ABR9RT45_9ACTN|nr:ABC transporter permease [Nocardioides malaquae]MBE7324732.1 ABC transporter permease [Nocardioides malaquae]
MSAPVLSTPGAPAASRGPRWRDRRTRTLTSLVVAGLLVLAVAVVGTLVTGPAGATDLAERHRAPSLDHLFGTDAYGRDLLWRTLVGLRLSLVVGTVAAVMSGAIALVLALVAVAGGRVGAAVVDWLVDLFLALPHLVLLILLAFALGGGTQAVVLAVGLTHWPRLTRVLVAKARETTGADYVQISRALGRSRLHVARHHLAPHLLPHFSVGVVLMFPHAILHEAALSFLGLGIDPGQPAIGILLSDSMRSLSAGHWWLAALPGLALLVVVKLVDRIGDDLRLLVDPRSAHL